MFFSSVFRRLIEQSTSCPRTKFPEEFKLVPRRFIGSNGYKSAKVMGRTDKTLLPHSWHWSFQIFGFWLETKHCCFRCYFLFVSIAKFGPLFNQFLLHASLSFASWVDIISLISLWLIYNLTSPNIPVQNSKQKL